MSFMAQVWFLRAKLLWPTDFDFYIKIFLKWVPRWN